MHPKFFKKVVMYKISPYMHPSTHTRQMHPSTQFYAPTRQILCTHTKQMHPPRICSSFATNFARIIDKNGWQPRAPERERERERYCGQMLRVGGALGI
jgi:hypothetical protein